MIEDTIRELKLKLDFIDEFIEYVQKRQHVGAPRRYSSNTPERQV